MTDRVFFSHYKKLKLVSLNKGMVRHGARCLVCWFGWKWKLSRVMVINLEALNEVNYKNEKQVRKKDQLLAGQRCQNGVGGW